MSSGRSPSFIPAAVPAFGGGGASILNETKTPKMDFGVTYFTPQDFDNSKVPMSPSGGHYFGNPAVRPAMVIPHDIGLIEPDAQQHFTRQSSDTGAQMLAEAQIRWAEEDARKEEERQRKYDEFLERAGYGQTGATKAGMHSVVMGRHVPRAKQLPLTYGEMVRLPAGYVPGPPGFGFENYMRAQPPPDRHRVYPDAPIGAPMSHGHPEYMGRAWEDSAPGQFETDPLMRREGSTLGGPVRIRREPTTDNLPNPAENMLNPHATVAEREYEARVVFRKFDDDGNDYLDLDEFVRAMNYLGVELTYDDARPIYAMFDEDGSGEMDEEEFVRNYLNNYT